MLEQPENPPEDKIVVLAGGHDLVKLTSFPLGDANGIPTLIEVSVGTFAPGTQGGSIRASLYDELWYLGDFRDDLHVMYSSLKGTAEIHGEGSFQMEVKGDGLGHFQVRGTALAR